jgi:hypothetical protein
MQVFQRIGAASKVCADVCCMASAFIILFSRALSHGGNKPFVRVNRRQFPMSGHLANLRIAEIRNAGRVAVCGTMSRRSLIAGTHMRYPAKANP